MIAVPFSTNKLFELIDLIESLRDDLLRHQTMHARDQHVFMLRPVKMRCSPLGGTS